MELIVCKTKIVDNTKQRNFQTCRYAKISLSDLRININVIVVSVKKVEHLITKILPESYEESFDTNAMIARTLSEVISYNKL